MLFGLLQFIDRILLQLIMYVIIAQVIVSWLIYFNVINMSNQFVALIARTLYQLTEPLLRPIRRFMPNTGGLDLSPLVLVLVILFIRVVILPPLYRMALQA